MMDTCALTVFCIAFFFCPHTGYTDEYQYYFPVGGKWYWMVAKLLEGRQLSWLKEPFSILSLSKCVFVWLNVSLLVCMCKCVFRHDEEQSELELTAHVTLANTASAGWKSCNQTINQKSLNCYPPTSTPSFFATTLLLLSYRAHSIACYNTGAQ